MATQITKEGFYGVDLPLVDQLLVQEPWWLLLAVIPVIFLLVHCFQKRRITDLRWKSAVVRRSSVIVNRRWPRHLITVILVATMLILVYPAARPVNTTTTIQKKALLVWVYDASESMTTVDVARHNQLVSRLDASVSALEDSLETLPADFYKLLISYSESDQIEVGLPTLNNIELLRQAREITHGEYTATDYALDQAVTVCQQFFNDQNNTCVIFLLSDGECNPRPACNMRSEDIAEVAAERGITIHTISWGDPESEYPPNPKDMKDIAKIANGTHLSSDNVNELTQLYNNVAMSVEVQEVHQSLASPFVWATRIIIVFLAMVLLLRRLD